MGLRGYRNHNSLCHPTPCYSANSSLVQRHEPLKALSVYKMTRKRKACRACGLYGHSAAFCWSKPRKRITSRVQLRQLGKKGTKWFKFRGKWFDTNEPNEQGFYVCYICGDNLKPWEVTLDHVYSRSSRPDLVFDDRNIEPCCYLCNMDKGSVSYNTYALRPSNRISRPYTPKI